MLSWKDQITVHCENRGCYGLGMAMCKASLPADLTRFQNSCVSINSKRDSCQKEPLKL